MSELESESMINDWKKKGDVKKVLYMHDVYNFIVWIGNIIGN